MPASSRREKDREQRRSAANHRIGHDHAYGIIYGGVGLKLALAGGALMGMWWIWHRVDHLWIVVANIMIGGVLLAAGVALLVKRSSLTAKQMRMATRQPDTLAWLPMILAGLSLLTAAYLIRQS
jgi:hypothetical protein